MLETKKQNFSYYRISLKIFYYFIYTATKSIKKERNKKK
jgi:hypothetical protein